MFKKLGIFISFFLLLVAITGQSFAFEQSKLGVHILSLDEATKAKQVVTIGAQDDTWNYVTIPFTLDDLHKKKDWQKFFDTCAQLKLIPLVRLTTRFSKEQNAWEVPNKRDIVNQISFLSALRWPTDERHIIVFNEVNHAKEWGGTLNPQEYTKVLRFVADWAHTEQKNYVVLPAGFDLAAPNAKNTKEAFAYLSQMLEADPDIFEVVDVWNSHSYPNPGFSSSPTRFGKNSLRGYQYELAYLKQKTGKEFKVMITETGWEDNKSIAKWLSSYYAYAFQHIWSDERVLAVTPFVLKGSPGPFEGFSLLDVNDQPTNQLYALQSGLEKAIKIKEGKLSSKDSSFSL